MDVDRCYRSVPVAIAYSSYLASLHRMLLTVVLRCHAIIWAHSVVVICQVIRSTSNHCAGMSTCPWQCTGSAIAHVLDAVSLADQVPNENRLAVGTDLPPKPCSS